MNKFLKSVNSATHKKDELIKKAIMTHLRNSIKELQYSGVETCRFDKTVDMTEAANELCVSLEAIFLHGLKDSLTHRFRRALADIDERPNPNFWAPLLIISHRQIIDQILALPQITTEIGQCRAWIRLALNDSLLSSYIMAVQRDCSALKSFYRVGAFVRDSDLLDVAQKLIEGFEAIEGILLPYNSSLLNTWTPQSLYLAGIWAQTLKACPVAPCDDIAQSLDASTAQIGSDTGSETTSLSSSMSFNSQNSGLRQVIALNENEILKRILSKAKNQSGLVSSVPETEERKVMSAKLRGGGSVNLENETFSLGNSLNRGVGWSFDENAEDVTQVSAAASIPLATAKPRTSEGTFDALLESYSMFGGDYIRTPNLKEVWQKIDNDQPINPLSEQQNTPMNESFTENNSTILLQYVGKISQEKGLDVQDFACAGCKVALQVISKVSICSFTSEYFCTSCMSEELSPIPARIIHNWDFKHYPISAKAFNYLSNIKNLGIVDFKIMNQYIYGAIQEMADLQILRTKLNYLRAYLYTCRDPVIQELQTQMNHRDYLYEHIHQYSINDLLEIPNGMLVKSLQQVVEFGKEHVASCWLCSQKGFVCEVCNKPKTLFPFDVENVYRCDNCNAVYHKGCLNAKKPCPKCKRKKDRENLPLLGGSMD